MALGAAVSFFACLPGCEHKALRTPDPAQSHSPKKPAPTAKATAVDACHKLWAETLKRPSLPGAPGLERQRAALLSRAKAEPVLFLRTPRWAPASSNVVSSFRNHLSRATHHWDALRFQLERFRARPDIGREVLLKEGYVYSEHPHMAYAMDHLLKPEHLFQAERIWIQRGQRIYHARRTPEGSYTYEDGNASAHQTVALLYLDRVGVGTPPEPLHVDLRDLRMRLNFDQLRLIHLSQERLLVELKYGASTVQTVLHREGARLSVECEMPPKRGQTALAEARRRSALRKRGIRRLQWAIHDQVLDTPPFDEPRNEVGDEDGELRSRWLKAYQTGRDYYTYEGQPYEVFNAQGRASPPQVCVDFVTDTLERAGGTWFNPRGQIPRRSRGALDLSEFQILKPRRVPNLLSFAEQQSDWFDVYTTEPKERIPLGHRKRFFAYLQAHAGRYRTGDIVIVRGFTAEDRERMHYHSFFIYETDPISNVPIAIVGNAGFPHIWSLEDESRRAPDRSVWHRIRPRLPLLQKLAAAGARPGSTPAPLVEAAL